MLEVGVAFVDQSRVMLKRINQVIARQIRSAISLLTAICGETNLHKNGDCCPLDGCSALSLSCGCFFRRYTHWQKDLRLARLHSKRAITPVRLFSFVTCSCGLSVLLGACSRRPLARLLRIPSALFWCRLGTSSVPVFRSYSASACICNVSA